jgi:hypothetical protein
MTYLRDGIEYLDRDEQRVWQAIVSLNRQGRTTNASQVTRELRGALSRQRVTAAAADLKRRGYLHDTGKGSAYHWRTTAKKPIIDTPATTGEK